MAPSLHANMFEEMGFSQDQVMVALRSASSIEETATVLLSKCSLPIFADSHSIHLLGTSGASVL